MSTLKLLHRHDRDGRHDHGRGDADSESMAKDPVCGMLVAKATALSLEASGRTYY